MLFVELKSNFIGNNFLFSVRLESRKNQLIVASMILVRTGLSFVKLESLTFLANSRTSGFMS